MTRYAGFLIVLLLALTAVALRVHTQARSENLLESERRARATVMRLFEASHAHTAAGQAHPGLEALLAAEPGLTLLEDGTAEQAFAVDDVFVYGLVTTADLTARRSYGFILRAWPLHYGHTGDREYPIDEGGVLSDGLNQKVRGGTAKPPPFPAPLIDDPSGPWHVIRATDL